MCIQNICLVEFYGMNPMSTLVAAHFEWIQLGAIHLASSQIFSLVHLLQGFVPA